jgi:hypothetical protein
VTVLSQKVRMMPWIYSAKRYIQLGEVAKFDLSPGEHAAREIDRFSVVAFYGADSGTLVPVSHSLWLHSIFRVCINHIPIREAPLFRLAEPRLYPNSDAVVHWKFSIVVCSGEVAEATIFTPNDFSDRDGYTLMLTADMVMQELISQDES